MCRFSQVVFIPERNLTHNLFFSISNSFCYYIKRRNEERRPLSSLQTRVDSQSAQPVNGDAMQRFTCRIEIGTADHVHFVKVLLCRFCFPNKCLHGSIDRTVQCTYSFCDLVLHRLAHVSRVPCSPRRNAMLTWSVP